MACKPPCSAAAPACRSPAASRLYPGHTSRATPRPASHVRSGRSACSAAVVPKCGAAPPGPRSSTCVKLGAWMMSHFGFGRFTGALLVCPAMSSAEAQGDSCSATPSHDACYKTLSPLPLAQGCLQHRCPSPSACFGRPAARPAQPSPRHPRCLQILVAEVSESPPPLPLSNRSILQSLDQPSASQQSLKPSVSQSVCQQQVNRKHLCQALTAAWPSRRAGTPAAAAPPPVPPTTAAAPPFAMQTLQRRVQSGRAALRCQCRPAPPQQHHTIVPGSPCCRRQSSCSPP